MAPPAALVFLCNDKTEKQCLEHKVLGNTAQYKKIVERCVVSTPLYLYNFSTKTLLYGMVATGAGGMRICQRVPFCSRFPAQVRFVYTHTGIRRLRGAAVPAIVRRRRFELSASEAAQLAAAVPGVLPAPAAPPAAPGAPTTKKARTTSHTILVVDQSGSMRMRDISGEPDTSRSMAVYTLLRDMLRGQLAKGFSGSDRYSLIEYQDDAKVVFDREPLTAGLVGRVERRGQQARPRSHGCYAPALKAVGRLAAADRAKDYAVCVLFISDGKPSDSVPPGSGSAMDKLANAMVVHVRALEASFGVGATARLRIHTLGVGGEDFKVLAEMAKCKSSAVGRFHKSKLNTSSLRAVLGTFSSSLMETRSSLLSSSAEGGGALLRRRPSVSSGSGPSEYFCLQEWGMDAERFMSDIVSGRMVKLHSRKVPSMRKIAVVAELPFAHGAERNVFHACFRPKRTMGQIAPPGDRLSFAAGRAFVIKESKFVEKCDIGFHIGGLMAQLVARQLANNFTEECENKRVRPKVLFECIEAFIVELEPVKTQQGRKRYVTVEPLLTLRQDEYVKWNSNAGGVRQATLLGGRGQHGFLASAARGLRRPPMILESFAEEDEEESSVNDMQYHMQRLGLCGGSQRSSTEVPQAFSHYTYVRSKGTMLVCDIQGVRDAATGRYRITDPVVQTKTGRQFGRTDRGKVGIADFLSTHVCNSVCKALELPIGAIDGECSICLDTLVNPKTLPCRHTFCKGCLEMLQQSGQSACPLCRAVVSDGSFHRALLTTMVKQNERRGSRSAAVQREELNAMYR